MVTSCQTKRALKNQPGEAAPRGGQRLNLEKDIGNFNVPWPDAEWWGKLPSNIFSHKLIHHCFCWSHLCMCCAFMIFCFNQVAVVRTTVFPHRQESFVHPTDHELFESWICMPRGTKCDIVFDIRYLIAPQTDIKILSPCPFLTWTFCFSSWGDLRLCQRHSES